MKTEITSVLLYMPDIWLRYFLLLLDSLSLISFNKVNASVLLILDKYEAKI